MDVLGGLVAGESLAQGFPVMRDLLALLAHLMATLAALLGPGGVKAVLAENPLFNTNF